MLWTICCERACLSDLSKGCRVSRYHSECHDASRANSEGNLVYASGLGGFQVVYRYRAGNCTCHSWGIRSSVDDLGTGRGVVFSRAAPTLRSIETHPTDWQICSPR